jgi:TolA-binding protein
MLKRGMALALLGKKPEACGVLGQLPAKYPSASQQLKSKADSERQRIGCN